MSYYKIIATSDCNYCEDAQELLSSHNKDWSCEYVDEMPWFKTILKAAGMTTVPQIFDENGDHIGGFTDLQNHLQPVGQADEG